MVLDLVTIASLLGQTLSVLKAVGDYVLDIRDCPEIIRQIQRQVSTWHLQLENLRNLETHGELQGNAKQVLQSKNVMGEAENCLVSLEALLDKAPRLQQQSGFSLREPWARVKWSATSKDKADELVKRLAVQEREIELALTMNNS